MNRMRKYFTAFSIALLAVTLTAISLPLASHAQATAQDEPMAEAQAYDYPAPKVFQAAGPDAASIQSTVDAYRTQLGTLNPNVAGSFPSGRRQIDWDGVPDQFAAPNELPFNFFNVNSPRGALFFTNGTGFQVSADSDNPTATPVDFGNLNAAYPTQFRTFSPQRLFTALGGNVTEVFFVVPGSNTPAAVTGFGAVFTDVDAPNEPGRRRASTRIEYFDVSDTLIFSGEVASSPGNETLSFFGIAFNDARIAKVRITSGDAALGGDESRRRDLVVMDDFIYGEPQSTGF